MTEREELFASIGYLVDQWCERRELGMLRIILGAYPMPSGLSDSWHDLYAALRAIRSSYHKQLPELEQEKLGEAIVAVGQILYPKDFQGAA